MGAELQIFVGDLTGPDEFGAGPETFADQSSGDGVGVFKSDSFSLLLPLGYTSGSPLSDTSTYLFETLASLGVRPGEYVWSWGSGADADTFTVAIGGVFPSPIPEPSTWAMLLLGFAGLGYVSIKRSRGLRTIP
jgi:PEP-CTERM motif